MRHRRAQRKFGLPSDQRRALLKGLTRSMLIHDAITTTEIRAKEVRPILEKLVTMARKGIASAPVAQQVHARRQIRRYVDSNVSEFARNLSPDSKSRKITRNPNYCLHRLFEEIVPRSINRNGGYTRITKIGFRRGDGAPIVRLEFVDREEIIPDAVQTEEQPKKRGLFGIGG